MDAVEHRYPNALIQFEDFQTPHANPLLEKYRDNFRMFNDDIQGTGTVALAAMMGAMRATGKPFEALAEQRFVVAGAGSAGVGIVDTLVTAMVTLYGLTEEQARSNFYLVDHMGLLGKGRTDLTEDQLRYMRDDLDGGTPLLDVLPAAEATVLLGVSGAGRIFNSEVLQWMADNNDVPLLFPMSNPTSKAECTAEEAFTATGGRAIFGSGSPFPTSTIDGKECVANQANNMYVFPGLGLGTVISGARIITDGMLMAAAEAVASYPSDEESARGVIFPGLSEIREVSAQVALATIKQALAEDLVAEALHDQLAACTDDELLDGIHERMWHPRYHPVIYRDPVNHSERPTRAEMIELCAPDRRCVCLQTSLLTMCSTPTCAGATIISTTNTEWLAWQRRLCNNETIPREARAHLPGSRAAQSASQPEPGAARRTRPAFCLSILADAAQPRQEGRPAGALARSQSPLRWPPHCARRSQVAEWRLWRSNERNRE